MQELKELREELNKTFTEFKAVNEKRELEVKKLGGETAETKEKMVRLNETLDKVSDQMKALDGVKSRMDQLETAMKRPPMDGDKGAPAGLEAKAVFLRWCRKGVLAPEEVKALTVGDDSAGGYLAPSEYIREIIKGIVEFSPVRSIARVRTTSARSVMLPKRTGIFSVNWVAETGTRPETTGQAYGMEEIPVHEMAAEVLVSFANLEDSVFNLEAELSGDLAEQFGTAEGTAFISGNANGKPEGILTNSSISVVNSGSASTLTPDGLLGLAAELKSGYARNGTWLLNRKTLFAIRKFKDAQNQYLWQPGLAGSLPAVIVDRPYITCPDMPDVAANAKPIAFGDFSRGYAIVDRLSIQVQRDPFTKSKEGKIVFTARKRVGGQVVLAEAIKIQKVAA